MKIRRANEFLLILECEDPEKELKKRTTYPHEAEKASFVQLYKGNLEERVKKHVGGKFNVPNPKPEYVDKLLREYRSVLSEGGTLFQFVFKKYVFYDTFEDDKEPTRPDYERVDNVPDEWPTVKEAAKDKDIDKSTVNSQIYDGELRAVMSDGRRHIEPDKNYDDWSPRRKKSYLRDRRLVIAKEVLLKYEPIHLSDFFEYIVEAEKDRFGSEQIPDGPGTPAQRMEAFFEDVLQGGPTVTAPKTIWEWNHSIEEICDHYSLGKKKKAKRAFPEGLLDEMIHQANQRELEDSTMKENRTSRDPASPDRSRNRGRVSK